MTVEQKQKEQIDDIFYLITKEGCSCDLLNSWCCYFHTFMKDMRDCLDKVLEAPDTVYTVPPHTGSVAEVPKGMKVVFYDPAEKELDIKVNSVSDYKAMQDKVVQTILVKHASQVQGPLTNMQEEDVDPERFKKKISSGSWMDTIRRHLGRTDIVE
jgi:hypothetical protein